MPEVVYKKYFKSLSRDKSLYRDNKSMLEEIEMTVFKDADCIGMKRKRE
jgi:hypothetical protein